MTMQINRQALRSIIPDETSLLFAEQIPPEYQSDALGRRTGTADALVFARSTEEVSGVLRYADENGIPVTPRGAATNLVGSTIPLHGGIILDVSRMNRILELDRDTMTATVETVCLLSKLNAKQHIEVDIHMDELDLTDAEKKATYSEIKEYVLEHTGLKVSSLYIAQVKQKCGIIERENYNKPKSDDTKQPQCPPDKEKAIKEALKHFGMI